MSVNMHAILVGLLSVSHTPEQADHAAQTVLDQHAHELAERQRAWIENRSDMPWWADQIPDVIDPKAQRASTEGDAP